MKNLLLALLSTLLSFPLLVAQITDVPDPVFEQALIDANIDSNGLNGNILNSDAAPITQLIVDTLGISDLSGIEAFVNLEWLEAMGNSLLSVDLSSNAELENLDLSFNQLEGIDLSQNDSLTHINLEGNALPAIDVSHLAMLDDLDIGGNRLTSIDVANNPLLTSLEIWNIFSHTNRNQIDSIDLSNNPLLFRFLAIDNLLTSLDVSNNPALFTLNCSDNLISELDLSNNPNLFTLSCSNNLLTELDVADLELGGLNCYGNQIGGLLDLAASSDLVILNCHNNQLDSIILPPTPYILDLYVHDNELTSLDVSHLGIIEELICHNNQLQFLNMRNGTNTLLRSFTAYDNPQLPCIQVDDVTYATATFTNAVDPGVLFSEDCASVGIEEMEKAMISVFPNPASEWLFSSPSFPVAEIWIYNAFGKVVQRAPDFPVSLHSLAEGVYVIRVTGREKEYHTRFIKAD